MILVTVPPLLSLIQIARLAMAAQNFGNYDNPFWPGGLSWPVSVRYDSETDGYRLGRRIGGKALAYARMHLEAGSTAAVAAAKSGGSAATQNLLFGRRYPPRPVFIPPSLMTTCL